MHLAADAVSRGARHIVAVGGDGTVHEVANGLLNADADAALGVVPIGSGNDFAKLAGVYRHDPVRAVARIVTARSRRFGNHEFGLPCALVIKHLRDGERHDKNRLNEILRDHGATV